MSTHPLAPRVAMRAADFVSGIAQDAYQTKSIAGTALCTGARELGRILPYIAPMEWQPLFIPSYLVLGKCGNNAGLRRKICWIAPVVGIGLTTAAAYTSYGLVSSTAFRSLICGAHSGALGILSAPFAGSSLGIISLQNVISNWIGLPDAKTRLNNPTVVNKIETQADFLTFLAFAVSSIGLTVLGSHPIVATTTGFVISTTVKIVSLRILMSHYTGRTAAPSS